MKLNDLLLDKIIQSVFREVQRYIKGTHIIIIIIPYSKCINLSNKENKNINEKQMKVTSLSRVYKI